MLGAAPKSSGEGRYTHGMDFTDSGYVPLFHSLQATQIKTYCLIVRIRYVKISPRQFLRRVIVHETIYQRKIGAGGI